MCFRLGHFHFHLFFWLLFLFLCKFIAHTWVFVCKHFDSTNWTRSPHSVHSLIYSFTYKKEPHHNHQRHRASETRKHQRKSGGKTKKVANFTRITQFEEAVQNKKQLSFAQFPPPRIRLTCWNVFEGEESERAKRERATRTYEQCQVYAPWDHQRREWEREHHQLSIAPVHPFLYIFCALFLSRYLFRFCSMILFFVFILNEFPWVLFFPHQLEFFFVWL